MLTTRLIYCCLFVLSAGCASVSPESGRQDVHEIISERGQPVLENNQRPSDITEAAFKKPLTLASAKRIALINNPYIKLEFTKLGIAAADVYEASRIRNPVFGSTWLNSDQPGERDLKMLDFVLSLADLITLSSRKRMADTEFALIKQSIGAAVLETLAEVEGAYVEYIALKQASLLSTQIARASDLAYQLALRYHAAGNLTAADLALERASAAESQLAVKQMESNFLRVRQHLALLLGLSVSDAWETPDGLPKPVATEDELDGLLALAESSRLDFAVAVARTEVAADRLGITDWSRWIGEIDIGVERERETDGAILRGPTVELEVPLFDQGRGQVLRAEAELQMALTELAALRLSIENSVRTGFANVALARERIDLYENELIPARISVVARTQERESYMLTGIFELLSKKQQEYDAYYGYFQSIRDYWLARAELTLAVGNELPSSSQKTERITVDSYLGGQGETTDDSAHMMDGMKMDGMKMDESGNMKHDMKMHESADKPKAPEPAQEHHQHMQHDKKEGGTR